MTAAERKAKERERKRALGLVPKEIWVHPDDWGAVVEALESRTALREAIAEMREKR